MTQPNRSPVRGQRAAAPERGRRGRGSPSLPGGGRRAALGPDRCHPPSPSPSSSHRGLRKVCAGSATRASRPASPPCATSAGGLPLASSAAQREPHEEGVHSAGDREAPAAAQREVGPPDCPGASPGLPAAPGVLKRLSEQIDITTVVQQFSPHPSVTFPAAQREAPAAGKQAERQADHGSLTLLHVPPAHGGGMATSPAGRRAPQRQPHKDQKQMATRPHVVPGGFSRWRGSRWPRRRLSQRGSLSSWTPIQASVPRPPRHEVVSSGGPRHSCLCVGASPSVSQHVHA